MPNFGNPLPGRKKADPADTPTCGQAIVFNCATNLWQAACVAGGETNTSSNSGCGDGWALAKCGVDLPFKSLITTSPIATTVNATDLTIAVDNIPISALADATDGNLITYDACGAPAFVATGTAAQVLTSNGVGTAPTFQAAGGGGGCGWDDVTVLASDQSKTCSTTLSTITGFTFCACACSTYSIRTMLQYTAHTCADIKFDHAVPTNATYTVTASLYRGWIGTLGLTTNGTTLACYGTATGTINAATFDGALTTTCAGSFAVQFAQLSSNSNASTVKAGSFIMRKKG